MKVLTKRTEANVNKFSLVLDSKILGTMFINKSKVCILFIFKGNNFFLSLFLFLDLTFLIILFS